MRNQSKEKLMMVITSMDLAEVSRLDLLSQQERFLSIGPPCLEVFQLAKVMPKLLSRKRIFCELLEP